MKKLTLYLCFVTLIWYPPNAPVERYENVCVNWLCTNSASPRIHFRTAEGKIITVCGVWKVEE